MVCLMLFTSFAFFFHNTVAKFQINDGIIHWNFVYMVRIQFFSSIIELLHQIRISNMPKKTIIKSHFYFIIRWIKIAYK